MSLSAAVCADIRRRVGDGRQPPLQYMNVIKGFRLQADDGSDQLILVHMGDTTTKEEIGYREFDQRLPGMRWYLSPSWRNGVQFLISRLGMDNSEEDDEIPF